VPSKIKLIWSAILTIWFVAGVLLSPFGITLPGSSQSASAFFYKADEFLLVHNQSPTALGLFFGLLVGTVIIPAAWTRYSLHLDAIEAKGIDAAALPLMTVTDIAEYIRDKSAWGWRKRLELNFDELVTFQIPEEMRRAGASAEVRYLGTPPNMLSSIQLDRTYSRAATIDEKRVWDSRNQFFTTEWGASGTDRVQNYRAGAAPRYDVMRTWPSASMWLRAYIRSRRYLRFKTGLF
jgi:hypothetical protein